MTRKEQNKILDDKTESNINQYKVDRLNAEISAFSSGDLKKYEFLTRKDLKYKPNALDKARFEFSPLDQTFNTGLDKIAQGYQEESVIKLLKDITDGLARGFRDDNDDNDNDDNDDNNENDNNDNDYDDNDNDDNDNDDNDNDDNDNDDNDNDDEQERFSKLLGELRTNEDNEGFRNKPKEDKLDTFVNDNDDKVFNVLNQFKSNIQPKMSNLDKMVTGKNSKWSSKLNKLNNEVKKFDNYIKENNDKKINIEKKLDIVKNERDNLLLKYNQLKSTKNALYETKDKLDKAGNDINEKTKYTDKLKEIQEKLDYQNAKETQLFQMRKTKLLKI